MAGKNFKINPNEKMAGNATNKEPEPTKKQMQAADKEPESIQEPKKATGEPLQIRRKAGRPKKNLEPTKMINVAIPEHVYEKMQYAKCCYNGNITQYINSLIAKDLDENYDKLYMEVYRKIMNL